MSENKTSRYWIHTITPLHVGAGRGLGYIDLPISREKVTNWPYIPGSSVKGVIADYHGADENSRKNKPALKAAFGTTGSDDGSEAGSAAGALVFTDAHILCLPVRSFYGTFAWITSPFCLQRLNRDFHDGVGKGPEIKAGSALVTEDSKLLGGEARIYLEDLDVEAKADGSVTRAAHEIGDILFADDPEWKKTFQERFAIVDDDIFTFLCEAGTEVNAHIRIDEKTGIVAKGALWYEEALPVEAILTGGVWCDKVHVPDISAQDLIKQFCTGTLDLQMGGKASTGKGLVHCVFEAAK